MVMVRVIPAAAAKGLGKVCAVAWSVIAMVATAQDSEFTPMKPVPPHTQAWVEATKPDIQTVFLWKFITAADRDKAVADVLEKGSLDDLLEENEGPALTTDGQASVGGYADRPPKIVGDAKVADHAGRFGGGLAVNGAGYAEGAADLPGLVSSQGGFTIDSWFRMADVALADKPQTLLAIPDARGDPLLAVVREASAKIMLCVEGKSRITVPVEATADGWHHLALMVEVPRGNPDAATLVLVVDAEAVRADLPTPSSGIPWMKGVLARVGNRLAVGGQESQTGLVGTIDEIRLSKGRRNLYPWNLGRLERARKSDVLECKAPYFKSGNVVTRFRFDGNLDPDSFAGRSWVGKATASHFQPGVQGQAIDLSAIEQTGFTMTGFDILPDTNGSIEFWFRPLDWNNFYAGDYLGTDVKHNWLMTLTAKGANPSYPSKTIEVRLGRSGQDGAVRWQKIHPGTWTHVLISIKDGRPTVYMNGQPQRLNQVALVTRGHPHSLEPLKKWRERTGSKDIDDTWTLAFMKSASLVDEFTVFDWAFDLNEAWNAYARWLPDSAAQMKPLAVFETHFDYFAHSWDQKEKLIVRVGCLPVDGVKPATSDIELRSAAGEVLLAVAKQSLDEASAATFTVEKSLSIGRYSAVVRSRDAKGEVLAEEKVEYVREQPLWLGNTLGKERTIPKPWTPIKVNVQTLELVGRRIDVGSNGFPEKIETHGRQILAGPIVMRAASPGGDAVLTGQGIKFGDTADDRVEWQAGLAGAGIKADVDGWLEFDGLLYCTVTLKPASGGEAMLDELDIDVPMVAAEATQLLANGGGKDFRNSWIATMVPAGEGSVWRSSDQPYPSFGRADGVTNFMPHIWLGSDDAGLYFGAENDQGWTVDGPNPAFRDWNHDLFTTGRFAWTAECEDYAVWAINEFLKRGVIDGVYWDDVSVGNTYSLDSTAYEYAGSKNGRRVGFTSLAMRRVNMRLWRLFEAAGREPCIWAHMTVCYEVPLFSFCRYLSNGEFLTGVEPYGKRDAMDFWKPQTLRLLGPAEKWGAGVSFLTTLPRSLPPGPAAEQWAYPQRRAEDALYATSGIQTLSEALTSKLVAEKVYEQPLRVFPWWEADTVVKLAKPEKANVLSAVYASGSRAIVFVSNFDRDVEREVTVELDLATLFPARKVSGIQWRDLDPGLEPPKVAVARAAEIAKETKAAADAGIDGKERPLDAEELDDFLEGTTPESRAKGRLGLKVEGRKARVTVRPRDYRVLEARPGG